MVLIVVKHLRVPSQLLALLLGALPLGACHYEDRRLASVAVAHGTMRDFSVALACYKEHTEGYPPQLRDLADPPGGCPTIDWLNDPRPEYPQPHHAFYDYFYTASGPDENGRFQHFGLMASGPKSVEECDVSMSFWLDDSGVLRQAPGRSAGRDHPPVEH